MNSTGTLTNRIIMKKNLRRVCILFSLASASVACSLAQTTDSLAVIKIHADQVAARVSPQLYGLMTEEINYSYDGGLYAELVRNRTFQDDPTTPVHWSVTQNTGATSSIEIDKTTGPSEALTLSLRWTIQQANVGARAGLANDGYWGVRVRPKTTYKASFYAMS